MERVFLLVVCIALGTCSGESGGEKNASDAGAVGDAGPDAGGKKRCDLPDATDPAVKVKGGGEKDISTCLADMGCAQKMVCAHRGFKKFAPENTIAAYAGAIVLGADAVEIDVRETKDEVLVVMHDDTVDRTTDGTGSVADFTLEEIKNLRVGEGLDDQGMPYRVPTFGEVVEFTREKTLVDLDVKTGRMDLVAAEFAAYDAYGHVFARKGSYEDLETLKSLDDRIVIMPDIHSADEIPMLDEKFSPVIVELQADSTDELVDAIHAAGMKAFVDVLGPADVLGAIGCDPSGWAVPAEAGVDMLQTDAPHLLAPYFKGVEEE